MNKKLEQKLFDAYPKIFAQKDLNVQQTAMCWGIQCGDGWYTLIDVLCEMIQNHVDHTKCAQVEATTVKEKFGQLRFYTHGGDDITQAFEYFALLMSINTCELCGTTVGVKQTEGWIYTMCKPCLKNLKNKQKRGSLFYRVSWFFYTLQSKFFKFFKLLVTRMKSNER